METGPVGSGHDLLVHSIAEDPDNLQQSLAAGYTIPTRWYTDRDIARAEESGIFRRTWQLVGFTSEVSNPGDYIVSQIARIPIIVTRDDNNQLHAMINVCRHRGSQLIDVSRELGYDEAGVELDFGHDSTDLILKGNARNIQCPYHAWTYGLDGSLRAAPHLNREPHLNKDELGLVHACVETWGPLVFVNLDPDCSPLSDTLSELPGLYESAGVDLDEVLIPRVRREYLQLANWKVVVDNFIECYHCPTVHPALTSILDVSDGWSRYDEYEYFNWFSVNSLGDNHGEDGKFAYVWPNLIVDVMADKRSAAVSWIVPIDIDRSVHIRQYCWADDYPESEAEELVHWLDQVTREDRWIVGQVQRGLESQAFDYGPLIMRSEQSLNHFHRLLYRFLVRE